MNSPINSPLRRRTSEEHSNVDQSARQVILTPPFSQTAAGVRQRENAIKERDRLTNEVDELNNRLLLMKEYVDEMEQLKQQLETKNKELYKLLDETSSESFKDKRSLESLRAELDRVTVERDQKLEEVNHFRSKSEAGHKSSIQTQLHVAALKSNIERLNTSNTLQSMKLSKLTGECENLTHLKDKLVHDLGVKSNILKVRERAVVISFTRSSYEYYLLIYISFPSTTPN